MQDFSKQVKLRWFPRILVNRKRFFIKRIIVGLKERAKEAVLSEYVRERQELVEQFHDSTEEFDAIDEAQFAEFLAMKSIKDPSPEQKQALLLDFYMNPIYNYYHIDLMK